MSRLGSKNIRRPVITCGHSGAEHKAKGLCFRCYDNRRNIKRRGREGAGFTWYLKKKYGLTNEQYLQMYEKHNGCWLCGANVKLHVDHDHVTGSVRGLLCIPCNTKLGWYERQRENLQRYLTGL